MNVRLYTFVGFAFAFLYLPIFALVIFSFNASPRVTVWQGFSTHWYSTLFDNEEILGAALLSLKVATMNATFSVILGTLAAFTLVRHTKFPGRTMFTGLVAAPLVMPEVITGLSLLLLFVASESWFGWPKERGITTLTIAHITFSLAFVAVLVQARLSTFDRSLEEAALNLGAPPWKVYFVITLPLIAPSLVSGWLLAFTMSLDDLVISSFVTGPGSSTLPMVVFSLVRKGLSPEINALATLFIGVIGLGIITSVLVARRGITPPTR
jgi:putrescine transport system permease protein